MFKGQPSAIAHRSKMRKIGFSGLLRLASVSGAPIASRVQQASQGFGLESLDERQAIRRRENKDVWYW